MRVVSGGPEVLEHFAIEVLSHVTQIGSVKAKELPGNWRRLKEATEGSPVRCADPKAAQAMIEEIEWPKRLGFLGRCFQVVACRCRQARQPSLGPQLDGQLAQADVYPRHQGSRSGYRWRQLHFRVSSP